MEIKEELLDIEGIKNSKKPILDLFIRRTAVITQTKESLVELIIKDQWKHASKLSQAGSPVAQIEFPNIGNFFVSKSKAEKRLKCLDNKIDMVKNLSEVEDIKVTERRVLSIQRYEEQKKNIRIKTKEESI